MRCDDFYAKWKRCGNFCEKHPSTASRIGAYLDQIEEMSRVLSEPLQEEDTKTVESEEVVMQSNVFEEEATPTEHTPNKAITAPIENVPMGNFSERSIRPLLKEKDTEIREEAIRRSALLAERKKKEFGKKKANISEKDMKKIVTEIRKEREPAPEPMSLPDGEYNVILADPPWRYDFSKSDSRKIENQYPTIETKDICAIDVPSSDNAVLFLWATAPKLREAIQVMESWGFEYKTNAVWVKDKIGMGYYWRSQHELLLTGTKGSGMIPDPEKRKSSVINGVRTQHSRKPDIVYDLIETMYPNGNYLEMFARKQYNNKWAVFGNDVTRFQ